MKITKKNSEHYKWGDQCDGWFFLKEEHHTVILERMPPHTKETRHFHQKAKQLFFIIKGVATIEINNETYSIHEQEGMDVGPGLPHQILNETDKILEFLVISQPSTKGDRFEVE